MNYKIYQLKQDCENLRELAFAPYERVKSIFAEDNYKMVYDGEIATKENESTIYTLERIYAKFNKNKPEDFKGHSLSTSDIVALDGVWYYCDSFGWEKVE